MKRFIYSLLGMPNDVDKARREFVRDTIKVFSETEKKVLPILEKYNLNK